MKNLGIESSFVAGREGAADYIIASSSKEQSIIRRDLHYDESQILITGLGQFSLLEYNHIDKHSPDVISVLLTWKPSDENSELTESTSYMTLLGVLEKVRAFLPDERIRLLAHPKEEKLLESLSVRHIPFWTGPIHEALAQTKLLITDYSSICYNSFYQGAGVIFYQPDIERYEAELGPLIPAQNEFIGPRAFSLEELEHLLSKTISQTGEIDLEKLRTEERKETYRSINEFSDGRNLDRIFHALQERNVL
jgi:CDP-glycerol glycerophosphotransferase (TagB/SpsB family)